MNVFLLAIYVISHCAGFAGFALMIALRSYDTESAIQMRTYNFFLFSFFIYLLPPNAAFFARAFLLTGSLIGEPWYYLLDTSRTSLLLTAASIFFWALPTKTGARRTRSILLVCSQLPLVGLAVYSVLVYGFSLSAGESLSLRILLMRTHVFLIAGLLGWSCVYFKKYISYAIDENCVTMMDLTIACNLVFIPFFIGISFVNFGADRPWFPLCTENIYYLVIHIANIFVLTLRGFNPPEETCMSKEIVESRLTDDAQALFLSLSDHERSIVELMSRGHANKQIAGELLVSEHAVRNTIYRLFKRFGVRNRVELAEVFRQLSVRVDRILV